MGFCDLTLSVVNLCEAQPVYQLFYDESFVEAIRQAWREVVSSCSYDIYKLRFVYKCIEYLA